MYSLFDYEVMAKENHREMEVRIEHHMLVLEAQNSGSGLHRSKLLVKLAKLLIRIGERMMSNTDREMPSTFSGASLQNL